MHPLITIITPVFNGAKYFEQTIQSVINQTYKNIEYIIIDGGSKDGTLDIIKKYEKHLSYWVSEPDKGIYDAMNKGIKAAKGDYIGIVNSDDYYEVDTVESIVQLVNNGKEADVFFGDIFYINPYFPKKVLRDDCRGDILKNGGFIWHPSVFIKSSCYREHGLYDLKYMITADYELLMRYEYENLVFQYINKPLSNFRSGGVSSYNMKCIYEKYHYQKKYYKSKFFLLLHIKDIVKQFIKISAIKFVGQRLYHKFQYRYLFSQFQKVDI